MKKDTLQPVFSFIVTMLIVLFYGHNLTVLELSSIALFFLILFKFIYDLGSQLSVKNIIALLMILQWLIGPILSYYYDAIIMDQYRMAVDKETYFGYILPATIANLAGLYLPFSKNVRRFDFSKSTDYYQKGKLLIIIGFSFEFLPYFGFLGYLLAGLKYVGVFYMIISPSKYGKYWIIAVFSYLFFIHSLNAGQFHEMLLWSGFLVMLIFYFKRKSYFFRFGIILTGFFLVLLIQIIKPTFRSEIKAETEASRTVVFFKLFSQKLLGREPLFSEADISNNVTRINQGWIISNVLNYMPASQNFVYGKTIIDAVEASIFPRFIMPDKAMAGGRTNMSNFAGINLNAGTSMDISQVGEAYANFGKTGGIFFMFVLGVFFNWVIYFANKKCYKYADLVFWIPLLFLQVIKAETSLVTVLNHLTKATIVTWFFFSPMGNYLMRRYFIKTSA